MGAEEWLIKTHFLASKYTKKRDALLRLPLRYYKDNTNEGEMQIGFNFLLQFRRWILRIHRRVLRVGLLILWIGGWLLGVVAMTEGLQE